MKNKFALLFLMTLIISCSDNSKYSGTWYNNSNFCDSLSIYKGEDKLVVEYIGGKFPAEVKDGYLEIYGQETSKASLGQENEILIDGIVFSKKLSERNIELNGEWKIHECTEKYEWSNISIKNDTISIAYGSPLEIVGTIKTTSSDTIAINYEYGAGSISMMEIVDKQQEKIDYKKPIAYIVPKSKNHFHFVWNGISIEEQKEKWLDYLDDELYWGEKAESFDYEIIFIKE